MSEQILRNENAFIPEPLDNKITISKIEVDYTKNKKILEVCVVYCGNE